MDRDLAKNYEKFLLTDAKLKIADNERLEKGKEIIRIAIENYLGWTPTEAMVHMDLRIWQAMKLDKIAKYVTTKRNFNNFRYCLKIAYEKENPKNNLKSILQNQSTVKSILNASNKQREIIAGLIAEFVTKYYSKCTVFELYEKFADKNFEQILKDENLFGSIIEYFGSPLIALHYCLPRKYKNKVLYAFYSYEKVYDATKKACDD